MDVRYQELTADQLDAIEPLWQALRAYHAALPGWRFGHEMGAVTWESRKRGLVEKTACGGRLRVEVVRPAGSDEVVAYCVSSLTADGQGEIDSVFAAEAWRGRGLGTELARRAMAWFDAMGAKTRSVAVAFGNEGAMKLYQRLGFVPRTVTMHHIAPR